MLTTFKKKHIFIYTYSIRCICTSLIAGSQAVLIGGTDPYICIWIWIWIWIFIYIYILTTFKKTHIFIYTHSIRCICTSLIAGLHVVLMGETDPCICE
jgi:hypothetical protein